MREYSKALIVSVALYLVQWIALPPLLPQFFPRSNEAYMLFAIFAIVAAGLGIFVLKCRAQHLLAADLVYLLLILLYPAGGAYGIGISGISLDGMQAVFSRSHVPLGAMIATGILLAVQMVFIVFRKAVRRICASV